jgi:hypothetical protein
VQYCTKLSYNLPKGLKYHSVEENKFKAKTIYLNKFFEESQTYLKENVNTNKLD